MAKRNGTTTILEGFNFRTAHASLWLSPACARKVSRDTYYGARPATQTRPLGPGHTCPARQCRFAPQLRHLYFRDQKKSACYYVLNHASLRVHFLGELTMVTTKLCKAYSSDDLARTPVHLTHNGNGVHQAELPGTIRRRKLMRELNQTVHSVFRV